MYDIPIEYIQTLMSQYYTLSSVMDEHTILFNNALYALIKSKYTVIPIENNTPDENEAPDKDKNTPTQSDAPGNISTPINTNDPTTQNNTANSTATNSVNTNASSCNATAMPLKNDKPPSINECPPDNTPITPPHTPDINKPNIKNTCPSSGARGGETSNTVFTFYTPPKLIFTTRKKYIKKIYKKIIVKIHPDKIKSTDNVRLFAKYFDICRESIENKKIHPMWIIANELKINIKLKKPIKKALILEINTLKKFNESITNSPVYKWFQTTDPSIKKNYLLQYISAFI